MAIVRGLLSPDFFYPKKNSVIIDVGNIMEAIIDKDGFIQITMIVKDIEKAVEGWCTLLGIEQPPINLCHMEGGEELHLSRKACEL